MAPLLVALLAWPNQAAAVDELTVVEAKLDRATLHTLGVQLSISGDDNRNASVSVRVREAASSRWKEAPPLLRVWPETVFLPVPEQFAGSIFDLAPATSYEIELAWSDPDGPADGSMIVEASTRRLPLAEPSSSEIVQVGSAAELASALASAAPGHVITLAPGTYAGSFSLQASGTAEDPIVIRGAGSDTVLDGMGCSGCNVLEVYGSHVYVERLTLQSAVRALRFQTPGAEGNVVRRVYIRDVVHGIGSQADQRDFTICDNVIEGRLVWPWTFAPDATTHWDDRGVDVNGDGHVICHNTIRGFGDPIVNKTAGSRAWDVYGNDMYDTFDGTEMDEGAGNVRVFGNRWTNVMAGISVQPMHGGPGYILRNVLYNVADEQVKLKSLGGEQEPSGVIIAHNTFVSPELALNLQTPITVHNVALHNNLFVGPSVLAGSRTVDFTAALDGVVFDYNGYYPDGGFWFGTSGGQNQLYTSFSEAQGSGAVEENGVLLREPIFEGDLLGPADATVQHAAEDFTPAAGSAAVDAGVSLPGLNGGYLGAAPDLGAVELGCPAAHYGPRAEGREALTNAVDCSDAAVNPSGAGGAGSAAGGNGSSAAAGGAGGNAGAAGGAGEGCSCALAGAPTRASLAWLALALSALRRRRGASRRRAR